MAYTDYIDQVQKIYLAYYQRPADPGGLVYWAKRLEESGGDLGAIIEAFADSPEAEELYGKIDENNIDVVISRIYEGLFGREPDPEGLAFYKQGFIEGKFTPATIALNVLDGAKNEDAQIIEKKVVAANVFVKQLDPDLDGQDFTAKYDSIEDIEAARSFLKEVEKMEQVDEDVLVQKATEYITNLIAVNDDVQDETPADENIDENTDTTEEDTNNDNGAVDGETTGEDTTGGGGVTTGGGSYVPPPDTTPPTVVLSYSVDGGATFSNTAIVNDADTLIIRAVFSEPIDETTGAKISINNDLLAPTPMTKVSSTVYTYQFDVPDGDYTNVQVSITEAQDASGNVINQPPTYATFMIDNTPPVAEVAAIKTNSNANVNVQSSEKGEAFLVHSSIAVNSLEDIENAPDEKVNSVDINTANSSVALSLSGLAEGEYILYTVDIAGNLSAPSQNRVTIDNTPPQIVSQKGYIGTTSLILNVNEAIKGNVDKGDFTISGIDATITDARVEGTSIILTLSTPIQSGDSLNVAFNPSGSTLQDEAGNALAVLNTTTVEVVGDNEAPTITSVSATVNDGAYGIGDLIPVTVKFNEPVSVTGTPQITLETGNVDRVVDYVSGSGSDTLVFNYVVQSGDESSDLDIKTITLNGGAIEDLAGNAADLTLPTGATLADNKDIVVDGIVPQFLATGGDTNPKDGEKLLKTNGVFENIVLDFTEDIQLVDGASLQSGISVITPAGGDDQRIAFVASITGGNVVIDLDENDPDIIGIDNQSIYLTLANGILQDAAGNLVAGFSNDTDYNLYLGV